MQVTGEVPGEVLHAAEFFAGELMDGRLHRHLHVEVVMDPTLESWAGLTSSDDDRIRKPQFFTIRLNPIADAQELIQALAHEMVHVKQYATGELEDHLDGQLFWKDELHKGVVSYGGDPDDEDAPPWEKEAYSLEADLYDDYLGAELY